MSRDMIGDNELENERRIWAAAKREHLHVDVDKAWAAIEPKESSRTSQSSFKYIGIAAAVIIVVFGIQYIPSKTPSTPKVYTTAPAQRATITLPDGSTVLLSVASKLSVSRNFNGRDKTVDLAGEAYFTVKSHGKMPFIVRTANHSAQVLGTSFVVRQYPNETKARVIVSEGKVGISGQVLSAGQGISVSNDNNFVMLTDADVTAGLAWTGGRLVLQDTPVREALDQIGRWYDVEFVIADSALAGSKVTATIRSSALTDVVLKDLAAVLDANVVRRGRVITVIRQ